MRRLGDDTFVRSLLGIIAVASYLGSALLFWGVAAYGGIDSEIGRGLTSTWTLCLGPIVGTVTGYYFGSKSTPQASSGKGLLALVITLFFFLPAVAIAVLWAWEKRDVEQVREYLELWALFSGPITGLVYGFYFSTDHR